MYTLLALFVKIT